MTFDDVRIDCDQEIELVQDPEGIIAYPLKYCLKKNSNNYKRINK